MRLVLARPIVAVLALVLSAGWAVYGGDALSNENGEPARRTRSGLLVLYDFSQPGGDVIHDRSGIGEPIHLKIADPQAVRWSDGELEVRRQTLIRSDGAATRVSDAVRQSGEITIEGWIRPARTDQQGPARIVTLSEDGSNRSFTLGQDGDRYDVRLRTSNTNSNGIPSLSAPKNSLATEMTQVVYTRDRTGRTRLYLNGQQRAEATITGVTSNWNQSYRLALANEHSRDRAWLGTYRLVAIYARDLLPFEVERHFRAGPDAETPPAKLAQATLEPRERQFAVEVAPLLARHCLECHGAGATEGELDLSRQETARAGGASGAVIIAGDAGESLLWQYVEADEMPADRPPLSDAEKAALRNWIDDGAVWSGGAIDPAAVAHGAQSHQNWLRRLTVPEYIETVRAAVGVDVSEDARRLLPADLRADGFSNTAYNLSVDLKHVEAFAELAAIIVSRMDAKKFAARFSKSRKLTDDDMRNLISKMGRRLLRGPLDDDEITTYRGISTTVASAGGDFEEAVRYILEAMLQSPRFIYRIENQRGDGLPWPVGEYELASRVSYILWGGPPDEELLDAAEAGKLHDRAVLETHVSRMLDDPRAVARARQFIYGWLDLGRLDNLRPNAERFENWDATLAADMKEETLAFFEEVAWRQNRPLVELLNAQITYVTPRLAEHCGLDPQPASTVPQNRQPRVHDGLEVLYTFDRPGGVINDQSGASDPVDVKTQDESAVQWESAGLVVRSPTLISAHRPPKWLVDSVKNSNAVTIEAWITPANQTQGGPARILTLSSGTGQRNFTLGQERDRFVVRLRSTRTDGNGLPALTGPARSAVPQPKQVVYTRDATGRAKLYLDGRQQGAANTDGDLSNWDEGFQLALANETTGDRPWLGSLHRVAVYSRALTPDEIRQNRPGPSRYDLSDVPSRGGLLTQGSVLTLGGDEASMVTRGLFVLHDLLRGSISAPPPCVDTTPVPTKAGLTQRGVAEMRIANTKCGGCHSRFEPLAFGLEKFDGIGAFHEQDEHGNKLRDDGEILVPGTDKPVAYQSSAEMMDLLAGSPRVRECLTWKVAQFALGRPMTAEDAPILDEIQRSAETGGGTYASLITAIVTSDLVRTTRTEAIAQSE